MSDYGRKYRSLASTYVEFSPDGSELLANLGGEQIYLFPSETIFKRTTLSLLFQIILKVLNRQIPFKNTNKFSFCINHLFLYPGYDKSHTRNGHTNGFKKQISIASQEQVNIQALSQNVRPGITIPECARKIQIEVNTKFSYTKQC